MKIVLLLAAALPALVSAQDFGDLEQRADEVAIVTLNSDMIRAAARICAEEKDEEAVRFLRALGGVTEIRVHALSFHDHQMPAQEEIARLRATVVPAGWPKFLESRSKDELVEGYMGPGGVALITWEPGEIATVRITGSISPESVPALGRHFGVPQIRHGLVIQSPVPTPSAVAVPPNGPRPDKLNFHQLVRDVESREGIHHLRIPLFGLVKPVAFVASAGSVRALDMAIFEQATPGFVAAVGRSVPRGWSPLLVVRDHDETTSMWVGEVGRSMHMLMATHDGSDGVLLTTKINISDLDKDPFEWHHNRH